MSKIFDALQRAEADGVAARNERSDTREPPDEESPPRRPGFTGWWKGLIVGMVVGALGAAIVRSYLVESRRSSAPSVPLAVDSPPEPAGAAALVVAPAQSVPESPAEGTGDTVTESTFLPEPPAEVAELAANEPLLPAAIATRVDALPSPSRSPSPTRSSAFRIQVGAFTERANAVRLAARLQRVHHPATIQRGHTSAAPWVVFVGAYPNRKAAEAARIELERAGFKGLVVSTKPASSATRVRGGRTRARSNG